MWIQSYSNIFDNISKQDMVEKDGKLLLTVTMSIKGPLSFIWRKLVGEKIVAKLPSQMEALVELAKACAKNLASQ
jgi:hypothetical protein